jgi:YegS/Rv2252/BmrU family lipid kinase
MSKTLIVLNPRAGSGRAGQVWTELEPLLWELLGELVIAVTQNPQDVAAHLEEAYAAGLTRIISIGGDGTNHVLVNALTALNRRHPEGPRMVYGNLPIGTGRDWARGFGIPTDNYRRAAEWIAHAQPKSIDLGLLHFDHQDEYFLNIASAGMGGDVVSRVNRTARRRPWTFLQATVESLMRYQPKPIQVTLDGKEWYDNRAYLLAVANGTTFGHGMKIAPNAQQDDGLFDVLVIDDIPRLRVLAALKSVYDGSHLTHPAVHHMRAAEVRVQSPAGTIGIELDGEYAAGRDLTFTVQPGALQVLA